jgi:penicillin amidase
MRAMRRTTAFVGLLALSSCSDDATTPPPAATVAALPVSRTTRLPGLDGPVDVATDAHGWSHVRATTLRDAVYVQGYLQARERMAQMDILRRLGSGTLGEAFGVVSRDAIGQDLAFRVIGLRRAAAAGWTRIQADPNAARTRTALTAFSAGVNQYLREVRAGQSEAPPGTEIVLSPSTPDWTEVDSLVIGRYQSYSLSYSADDEIENSQLVDAVRTTFGGADQAAEPARFARRAMAYDVLVWRPPSDTAVVPDFAPARAGMAQVFDPGTHRPQLPQGVYDRAMPFFRHVREGFSVWGDESRGSNNWVVTPGITRNRHAIVSNDPHLALRAPAIWWGTHLTVTGGPDAVDVAGTTFPGVPGVVIGFNQRVAWGVTTAYYDVTDVYQETITPGVGGAPDTVLFNGAQVPLQIITEQVPDGAGGTVEARIEVVPHHGPIVPEIANGRIVRRTSNRALSIRWTGHEATDEFSTFLGLSYARNVTEARAAVEGFGVGAQNFVFADADGNTGYASHAVIPTRAAGALTWRADNLDGTNPCTVLPGSGMAEWTGTVPSAQIPQAVGSATRPYIVTGNNDQTGQNADNNPFDATVYLGCGYASGWRAQRITERLQMAGTQVTVEDMQSVQGDHTVLAGQRFRPFLMRAFALLEAEWTTPGTHPGIAALAVTLRPRADRLRDAAARVQAWSLDGASGVEADATEAQKRDAVATSIFHAWISRVLRGTFGDETTALGAGGFDSIRAALHLLEHPAELHARAADGESVLWDDLGTADVAETRDLILLRSLDLALTDLQRLTMSEDVTRWLWGNLHTVRFSTLIPGTDSVLSIPPTGDATFPNGFPRPGGIDVVDASGPGLGGSNYSYGSGASQRFTVELSPEGPRAFNALPGGQSIDRASPHVRDEAELWRANRVHAVPYREADVATEAGTRWRFERAP